MSKAKEWSTVLATEKKKDYFKNLLSFIESERAAGKDIYPPKKDTFAALSLTPFDKVKVVVLGQDPYHGPGQAHGLCFSVNPGVRIPPSLRNIFIELNKDLGITPPPSGDLRPWAGEGVLLLNTLLSVERGKPSSHANKGWEDFTDTVLEALNFHHEKLVFLLWGSHAHKKALIVDQARHHILTAPHPSPFSANRGFFGCRHFSQANEYLQSVGKTPVQWNTICNSGVKETLSL
jgi:uracil-DNA glycosylase